MNRQNRFREVLEFAMIFAKTFVRVVVDSTDTQIFVKTKKFAEPVFDGSSWAQVESFEQNIRRRKTP